MTQMPEAFKKSATRTLLWKAMSTGESFHKYSVAARFGCSVSAAAKSLAIFHATGHAHVSGWTRNGTRGPMTKVLTLGPGKDVPEPAPLPQAFNCKRWRERHAAQATASWRKSRLKLQAKKGNLPKGNDPLLMAIMGVRL